ncbi:retrovirus-related pol polyprotein from transposon TNT 1-94, partial [Tanacetum coccineum]
VVQIVLWYLDSSCFKHMTGDRSQLTNFIHKFLGTVKFGNDQVAMIMGKHTCFIRNLEGVDLLSGYRGTNLYSLSIGDMMASSPICLLSKATKTKSWLWHRSLSHLNFGALNHLDRNGLVSGLSRLKFEKDYLCYARVMGKSKKQSHKPKSKDTNQEKLYLLHMDLYGPMRVASVNGKKYIVVIVEDYSWFIWVKFLASKDEAPDFIIKFLKMIQVRLNATIRNIRTDNGTKQNRTLVEAARTMLICAKALLFLWAEAVATACYTQNQSIIRILHGKTPYELLHDRKPDLSFLHLTTMASEQLGSGHVLQLMTHATSSSGLVSNPIPQQPCNPPQRDDWDLLFQPMFDEYFNPLTIAISPVLVANAPRAVDLADSSVSISIDQDAPSTYPSRSVSTRKQLQTDAMWCYFNAFLTSVKPKNLKQSMIEPSWIDVIQEEIHKFERLVVWELVPCPDKVMLIKLKWIYKVKTNEFGGVLKNKARLVAQGFRQEEDNFEESFAPVYKK